MAANHLVHRSFDKISICSPRLVITLGTLQKLRSGRLFLSLEHPTIRQNEGIATRREESRDRFHSSNMAEPTFHLRHSHVTAQTLYEFSQVVYSSSFFPCICQFPNFDICCSLPSRMLCSLTLCSLVVGKYFATYKQACYFVHARFKYRVYFCGFGYLILCFCFTILSVKPLLTAPFLGGVSNALGISDYARFFMELGFFLYCYCCLIYRILSLIFFNFFCGYIGPVRLYIS